MDTPLSDLTLPIVDDEGKICDPRVKNVDSLRSLWVKTRDADLQSNRMMAKVQALLDGEPPLPQDKLKQMGQGYLSNFNPGDAKAICGRALAAYADMLAAAPQVADIFLHTWGDKTESDVNAWQQIMSEQHGLVMRNWAPFIFRYAYVPLYFTWHGVAVTYFSDAHDWRWDVSHLGYFKIPRQTKASESEIEYGFLKVETQPHELLRYIKDPEYAKEAGWNVEAVRAALMQTRSPDQDVHNWTEFEARWKNNDLTEGETAPSIPIIHAWVREADGSYSLYQMTESSLSDAGGSFSNVDDFLCEKRHAFKNAEEAFTLYSREVGTNGTYHSVRGLGSDMYNAFQTLMRLRNRQVDLAFAAGPILQAEDEEAINSLQVTPFGPFLLTTEGVNVMQGIQAPNLNNSIQPAINGLADTISRNSSSYAADMPMSAPSHEKSKFQVMTELEQQAQLSITALNLYYQSADRHMREVVRRMASPDYAQSDPGGAEVFEWRRRCAALGVPLEAFNHIDHFRTRAARVVGAGSPAARRMALENLMGMYPQYDEYGRAQLTRDLTASVVGWEQAGVYSPRPELGARPPVDYAIADLQNAALAGGQPQAVLPTENHGIHLEVHIGKIGEYIAQFEQAGQNPEMFPQIVPPMEMLVEHAVQTLEQYEGPEAPRYRQALQNASEILVNGVRHIQKLENMQEQGQMGGEAQPQGGLSEELIKSIMEHQLKLKMMQEEAQAKRQEQVADAATKRNLRAMETAADIARKNASARAQTGT